jgi:hypothetical protein
MHLPPQPSGILSRAEFIRLSAHRGGPHVSVYLPTERAGPRTRENPVRLKNLLRTALDQLVAFGMRPTEARDLLAPTRDLEANYDFWQHQSQGLCLHIAPGFQAQHSLPLAFPELVLVSHRFHVRPLLDLFTADASFYLLALSMGDIRVFRCGRYGEQEVSVAGMPRSMADALWPDDPEKQRQFRAMRSGQAGESALLYNSEDALQQRKEQLFRYFRQVDESLHHLLRDESAPLVLAAVDYLHPIYAEANTYRHLLARGITGSPEAVPPDELRAKAWALVEPEVRRARSESIERFRDLHGTGLASAQVEEVVLEAGRGRVDTLFLARDAIVWARVSPDGDSFEFHERPAADDDDLVDLAAVRALTHGGRVYVLEPPVMPADSPLAATFRY